MERGFSLLPLLFSSLTLIASSIAVGSINDTEMVQIPAGEFTMGCSEQDTKNNRICVDSKPAHKVYLDGYKIDKYMVTYRRYNKCQEEGACTELFYGSACNAGMSWNSDHPVNCVDWHQAKALCEFEGKRLPTEAEWEKAARGTDGRMFPWGNQSASCDLAVMNQKTGSNTMGPGCGAGTTQPIGSKPAGASPYGVMDMAGNLFEWTADWFSTSYFANSPKNNPKGPDSGEFKVLRGSSWLMRTDDGLASNVRSGYAPLGQGYVVGFRCAKNL
ncbi:formylglycine-generating enzyme family protein [Spongorhabdus nitratireducens]